MLPYGAKKRNSPLNHHPHNVCDICSGGIHKREQRENNKRYKIEKEVKKEYEEE